MGRFFINSFNSLKQYSNGFSVYLQRPVLQLLFLGFSAGLPIMLVFSSLSFWLREAGAERASIGFFSWVTLAYATKWLWAPAIDKLSIPLLSKWLGRRRSWLLLTQVLLVLAISLMAFTDPQQNLWQMAFAAVLLAFFSATQDIVIDAFRIESGNDEQQAAMAATYMLGYRLAMMMATAGALYIADSVYSGEGYSYLSWQVAYLTMAGLMFVGIITTLLVKEPPTQQQATTKVNTNILYKIKDAFISPVTDLISRYKWQAVILIILICSYRISDVVMGVMANVFYVDMGYSKSDIAAISKVFGVIMTLVGAFFAGGLINRFGILPILLSGAILSAITNILFIILSQQGNHIPLLTLVISVDNLSAGIAMAAMIAFLSSLTNKEFTATQYAWLSSAMLLLPKGLGGFSGVWLESMGYSWFFTMTALLGIPTIIMICILMKQKWTAH